MLLDSQEIAKLESRLITLFDRTIRKGLYKEPGKKIKYSVKQAFSSKTFQIQLDKIIDEIVLYTIDYVDSEVSQLNEQISASTSPQKKSICLSASNEPLILTEEAVRQCTDLSGEIAESIIRTLKDEAIYQEHPSKLAVRVLDLWGGEKYRAERWARTFSADVATSTSLHRYRTQGIENVQFYATIDKRTSPQCRAMHGVVMITDSIESQKYRPPLHHHCRSALIPYPSTLDLDQSLMFENRDFTKPLSQDFTPLKDGLDSELIKKTFKEIEKFKDKYAIQRFILDEDIEKRLMKLKVNIEGKVPAIKPKVPKAKMPKETKEGVFKKLEDEIRNRTVEDGEKCYAIDKKGNVVFSKIGEDRSISFTPEELKLFKGNFFTHSHPSGGSFSPEDISMAFNSELKEMRAAGKYRSYVVKLNDGKNFSPYIGEKLTKAAQEINYDVRADFEPLIREGKLSLDRANALHWHEVWTRTFKKFENIDYSYMEVEELPK